MAATTEIVTTLDFGSPEISGVDCNDLVSKNLTEKDFPLEVEVSSCVGFKTYVQGIGLLEESHSANGSRKLVIQSIDEMQRLATDIEAIARLQKRALLMRVSFVKSELVIDQEPVIEPAVEQEPVIDTVDNKTKAKTK